MPSTRYVELKEHVRQAVQEKFGDQAKGVRYWLDFFSSRGGGHKRAQGVVVLHLDSEGRSVSKFFETREYGLRRIAPLQRNISFVLDALGLVEDKTKRNESHPKQTHPRRK